MIAARAGVSRGPLRQLGAAAQRDDLVHPTMLYCKQNERTGTAEINGRAVEIRRGDCFVLRAGSLVHRDAWHRFDHAVSLDLGEAWVATFVGEFPKDAALGIGRITVPEPDLQRWHDGLERLHRELTTQAPGGREAAQALLTLLAIDAARYAGASGPKGSTARCVVAEVFRHINERLAAPITLGEIARAVNFSPAYLTDLVKRETGRPIGSWIMELRLRRAEHLLTHTDQPIAQIAAGVGYLDANSFGRAFTKRRGVSPWQWRRLRQTAAQPDRT